MTFDWLYGPRLIETSPGRLELRSLMLDQDTVRDALSLVRKRLGDAALYTVDKVAAVDSAPVAFEETRLSTAAEWETRRLMIRGGEEHKYFSVDLRGGDLPTIIFSHLENRDIAHEVAELLLAEGKPRPRWQPLIPRLPLLAAGLAAVCWVWFLISQQPPLSFAIAGSLVVMLSAVSAWDAFERLRGRIFRVPFPGHRIRSMSRQEIRTRRADRHANLRLAALTLPAGAVIGAVVGWLFDLPWNR